MKQLVGVSQEVLSSYSWQPKGSAYRLNEMYKQRAIWDTYLMLYLLLEPLYNGSPGFVLIWRVCFVLLIQ